MPSYNVLEHREDWYPIEGFPAYFITKRGEVISCLAYTWTRQKQFINYDTAHIIKPWINDAGYPIVDLYYEDGTKKHCKLHILLAKTFIPNPNNYPIVRHLDDNKSNYDLSNLAWGTLADNANDAIKNGRNSCIKGVWARKDDFYKEYQSITDASRDLNVVRTNINKVLKGVRNHAGGYKFGYLNNKKFVK